MKWLFAERTSALWAIAVVTGMLWAACRHFFLHRANVLAGLLYTNRLVHSGDGEKKVLILPWHP